jgi:toxin ParE1/3/4
MQLEIAVRAARDLRELHLYGVDRYGASAADAYVTELFQKFDYLAQWPFSSRERLNARPPVRLTRQRAHNIVYAVTGERVEILRVFHHSVNWIDLL